MSVCSCHITYEFQSGPTFYSCLNIKKRLAESRGIAWRLSDCNWTRTHTQPFSQTSKMIELYCEYLSVRCIWVYFLVMSSTSFRVNPHYIVDWYCSCFEQGVPWHSGNFRVWIHPEPHSWHDKNIQSNAPCR